MDKITKFLPHLYLPLLLLLVAFYAWRPLEGGYDFWAHAAIGRWIADHASIPRETLFLWSEPGTPWVAHSWLSQLLFYLLLKGGGVLGVAIFNTIFPVLVFFLIWRLWVRQAETNFLVPFFFAIAIWVSAGRFQPRQEPISALLLTLVLAFLVAWSQGRFDDWVRRRDGTQLSLVAAPLVLLFFLWVNLHALVATGLIVLWLGVIGEFAQAFFGKRGAKSVNVDRARALLAIAVLCSLATLMNPYGLSYWSAANPLKPGSMAGAVEEWRPLWQPPHSPELWISGVVGLILLGACLVAWFSNPERRWMHLGWLFFAAALFAGSRRMFWLATIIFLVTLAANARVLDTSTLWRSWRRHIKGNMLDQIPPPMRLIARGGALLVLLLWVVQAASRHTPRDAGNWSTLVRNTPEGAARLIRTGRLPRRIFNDYEDSSYLHWRLNGAPQGKGDVPTRGYSPLYIDLINAYPDRLMTEYFHILDATPAGIKRLNARRIDCVVLGEHHWKNGLRKYLDRPASGWKRVFKDSQSIVWVRRKLSS